MRTNVVIAVSMLGDRHLALCGQVLNEYNIVSCVPVLLGKSIVRGVFFHQDVCEQTITVVVTDSC